MTRLFSSDLISTPWTRSESLEIVRFWSFVKEWFLNTGPRYTRLLSRSFRSPKHRKIYFPPMATCHSTLVRRCDANVVTIISILFHLYIGGKELDLEISHSIIESEREQTNRLLAFCFPMFNGRSRFQNRPSWPRRQFHRRKVGDALALISIVRYRDTRRH